MKSSRSPAWSLRRTFGLVVPGLLFVLSCAARNPAPPAEKAATLPPATLEGKRILILTSYGGGRPGVEAILDGVTAVLSSEGMSIDQIFMENLDLERANAPAYAKALAASLSLKYSGRGMDFIYVLEQPALNFYLSSLASLFPSAPVLAARASLPPPDATRGIPIVEQLDSYDIGGTIGHALELFPQARHVVLVAGTTESDRGVLRSAEAALAKYSDRIDLSDTTALSVDEAIAGLASAAAGTLALVLPVNRDGGGKTQVQMEVAIKVAREAKVPVFTLWDNVVGKGAVGGSVTDFNQVGRQAARFMADALEGRKVVAAARSTLKVASTAKFDWSEIRRWGGDPGRLSGDPVFINRTYTFWERYAWLAVLVFLFILLEAFLILVLALQLRLRRQAQAELEMSEARFRLLVEDAPEAIFVFDVESRTVIDANRQAELLLETDRSRIIGRPLLDWYTENQPDGEDVAESFARNFTSALAGGKLVFNRRVRSAGGAVRICEVRLRPLQSEAGKQVIRGSLIDITSRLEAEEELKKSLREKEVLLQEVYHRTKNNMQVIAAMLELRAGFLSDKAGREAMRDMVGRIGSMALVHRKLYESKDLSHVDLGDYVRDLLVSIREALLSTRPDVGLSLELEAGIIVPIDLAIPLGLVINELMVNAAKYAFPAGRGGMIMVGLSRHEGSGIHIEIGDDGIGLPEGYSLRNPEHFGLMTALSLIEEQLEGRMERIGESGTRFRILVPRSVQASGA